jgi:hypothetical protein
LTKQRIIWEIVSFFPAGIMGQTCKAHYELERMVLKIREISHTRIALK